MKVHSYCTNSGKDLILEYIDSLSDEERIDAFSALECMEKAEFVVIERAKELSRLLGKKFI